MIMIRSSHTHHSLNEIIPPEKNTIWHERELTRAATADYYLLWSNLRTILYCHVIGVGSRELHISHLLF